MVAYKLWMRFLTIFGDIHSCFRPPKTKAKQLKEVMKLIAPGDLVFRGYDYYLDKIILDEFGHCGVMIDKDTVLHSVAEGVCRCDVMDFFMLTDFFCIVRPKCGYTEKVHEAIKYVMLFEGRQYDGFLNDPEKIYCTELGAEFIRAIGYKISTVEEKILWLKRDIYKYECFLDSCDVIYSFEG